MIYNFMSCLPLCGQSSDLKMSAASSPSASSSSYDDECSKECSVSFTYDPNNNSNKLKENESQEDDLSELTDSVSSQLRLVDEPPKPTTHVNVSMKDLTTIVTIGTGTFGRVELARHQDNGQHFALKVLNMHKVVQTRQVQHVHSEKEVLNKLQHPFIVQLFSTDKDEKNLYMIMEFVPGGELFSYLRASRVFSNSMSRFYAAEIVSALDYIHSKNIVYRDLKPENLMLTKEGHIKMADFGFAKELKDRTYTLCGTPEYLAPESLSNKGHNKAVDWWALGVLIYEMMAGRPPFRGKTTTEIYDRIIEHKLKFPRSFNLVAKDLVKKLLVVDRTQRIGAMKNGARDVMEHKWFQKINWKDLNEMRLEPPIVPTLYHSGDTGNFDTYDENNGPSPVVPQRERDLFADW
ncbi:unnamed protein product [Auanema sp. JU1783]|nr:unnamed protein product [Auanema sp. JU1783]